MFWKNKLEKEEYKLCLIAVDQLIKKWENFQIEIDDKWYVLREKLAKLSK